MATENVTLLVDVEVDNAGAQKNLEETTRRIEILKKERTNLNAEIKKGNKITSEQAKQLTAVNQALKRETEEQKKYNKQINTTSNSLGAMRQKLIANKVALDKMDQSTRKGALQFRKLSKETDALNTKITKQEKGYGVATRQVGHYEKANGALGAAFPRLGAGIAQASNAMKAFTLSLLVNPVFLIIAAVVALGAALATFFTRTQKGLEKWEVIQATFSQTMDVLIDRFAAIGEAVFDFIELLANDPLKALTQFGDAITENLTNRFTGFLDILSAGGTIITNTFLILGNQIKLALSDVPILGKSIDVKETEARIKELSEEMTESFKSMGESTVQVMTGVDDLVGKVADSVRGLNKEITEEVALVIALTKQKQKLEKEEVKFIITNQRRLKQIAKLRLFAKDESNTLTERISALKKAQTIEETNLQQSIKFKERAIALDLVNNDTIQNEAQAIARVNELLNSGKQIRIDEIGLSESTLDDQRELFTAIAEIDKLRASSFNKQKLFETELTTLNRKRIAEEKAEAGTDIKEDPDIKNAEKLRIFREEQAINEIDNLNLKLESEKLLIQSQAEWKIENEQLTQNEIDLINEKSTADQLALSQRKAEAEIEISKRTEQAKLQTASDALGTVASLFEEGTTAYKVFATAQAVIDTYVAANAAYASVVGIPVVGPVLAPIAAGTAVVAGLANVAKINGVEFEHGGLVKGPSHDNGGIQMHQKGGAHLGEMEGNEYIISGKRTREIGVDTLNAINFGGASPASSVFANGGAVSSSKATANSIDSQKSQSKEMFKLIQSLPVPQVAVTEIRQTGRNIDVKENTGL